MRTSPVPDVSTNEMHAVLVHAFMWLTTRARRLAGVVSMKLTVSRRGVGPQYFDVITAMCWGSSTGKSAGPSATGANAGALTGLIRTAVSAALSSNRLGRALGVQTIAPFSRA